MSLNGYHLPRSGFGLMGIQNDRIFPANSPIMLVCGSSTCIWVSKATGKNYAAES